MGAKNQLNYLWSRSRNFKRQKFVYYYNCPHFSNKCAEPRLFYYTPHRESNAQVLAMGTHIKEGEENTRFCAQLSITCSPSPRFEVKRPACFLEPWCHKQFYIFQT